MIFFGDEKSENFDLKNHCSLSIFAGDIIALRFLSPSTRRLLNNCSETCCNSFESDKIQETQL